MSNKENNQEHSEFITSVELKDSEMTEVEITTTFSYSKYTDRVSLAINLSEELYSAFQDADDLLNQSEI
jgi:hypothetical protein